MPNLLTYNFDGAELALIQESGRYYVACRPVAEAIGLDWASQRQLIERDDVLKASVVIITTGGQSGNIRDHFCLPLEYLNGWLFKVSTRRVRDPQVRARLIRYQKECYLALYEYFFGQEARAQTEAMSAGQAEAESIWRFWTTGGQSHPSAERDAGMTAISVTRYIELLETENRSLKSLETENQFLRAASGIGRRRRSYRKSDARMNYGLDLAAKGTPIADIAEEIGVNRATIYRWLTHMAKRVH